MEDSTPTGILEEMTIDEVESLDPEVVVLGIASTEPHGPHLPYGTDVFQADAVCRRAVSRANDRGGRVLMYPTLPIGNNVNFKAFPFSCRIGVQTLMDVVLDIIDAIEADGVRKIVLVNGHGGNTETLRAALRAHVDRHDPGEGAFVCLAGSSRSIPSDVEAEIDHPSPHGGEKEVSRIMHLRPDLVREEMLDSFPIESATIDAFESDQVVFVPPWHGHLPQSAGGETRTSSAEKGEALVNAAADWIEDFLVELSEATLHDTFPYPKSEE